MQRLSTIEEGLVILAGHSLGGLLVADAALFNTKSGNQAHRVIGVLSFDTPFLGIHPHVIISGIASLFQGDGTKTESDMNDTDKVNMVKPQDSTATLASESTTSRLFL